MKTQPKQLIYLLFIIVLFSCQKEEIALELCHNSLNPSSDDVSLDLASEVALNFSNKAKFQNQNNKLKGSSSETNFIDREIGDVLVAPSEDGSPALYIINFNPKGYVIISGTQKESPILGYSENSTFRLDSIPITIAFWIADRMDKIQVLKNIDDLFIPDNIEYEWSYQRAPDPELDPITDPEELPEGMPGGVTLEQKGPLLETTWGQWWGYNTYLDPINGELPPTGCVATAMAQVMKFHEHPSTYDWSLMPNTYGTNETALLMYDIGDAVDMTYNLNGSGADMVDAKNALVNDFGYSTSVNYINFNVNTVAIELSHNRPVIMDGYHTYYTTSSGWWIFEQTTHHYEDGHAWVCDGYKRNKYCTIYNAGKLNEYREYDYGPYYLHMNWGWSGSGMGSIDNNGWFKYDDWEINGVSTSDGTHYNFQHKKKCIIGIKP
jgi:hypothetical protein